MGTRERRITKRKTTIKTESAGLSFVLPPQPPSPPSSPEPDPPKSVNRPYPTQSAFDDDDSSSEDDYSEDM